MSLDKFRLDGRVAIVTGGSKGLGRAMARALAYAGADVVVTSRHQAEAQAAADEFAVAGRRTLALAADTRDRAAVADMVRRTEQTFGKVDILVNNAGVGAIKPAQAIDDKDFSKVIECGCCGASETAIALAQ